MITDTINHVALVLDASSSMDKHVENLILVADKQIENLAEQSRRMNQETRVSVYVFADDVECVIFDKDVLRLPSIREHYRAYGWTALLDATGKAITDLEKTAQMYGDHAFLVFTLTDGQENRSRVWNKNTLKRKLDVLPENWTLATLVPKQSDVAYAVSCGFSRDNIAVWNADKVGGIDEAIDMVRVATDSYMTSRSQGIRGTKSLFRVDGDVVNRANLRKTDLTPVNPSSVKILDVPNAWDGKWIRDFVVAQVGAFAKGKNYYQLTKTEKIQPGKLIAVVHKTNGKVFAGAEARDVLGLPDGYVTVTPGSIADFDVFIQSNSVNRHLVAGTKVLVF